MVADSLQARRARDRPLRFRAVHRGDAEPRGERGADGAPHQSLRRGLLSSLPRSGRARVEGREGKPRVQVRQDTGERRRQLRRLLSRGRVLLGGRGAFHHDGQGRLQRRNREGTQERQGARRVERAERADVLGRSLDARAPFAHAERRGARLRRGRQGDARETVVARDGGSRPLPRANKRRRLSRADVRVRVGLDVERAQQNHAHGLRLRRDGKEELPRRAHDVRRLSPRPKRALQEFRRGLRRKPDPLSASPLLGRRRGRRFPAAASRRAFGRPERKGERRGDRLHGAKDGALEALRRRHPLVLDERGRDQLERPARLGELVSRREE